MATSRKKRKEKQIRNENRRHDKVVEESRSKAASTEHIIQTDKAKRPKNNNKPKSNKARNNLKQKNPVEFTSLQFCVVFFTCSF